MCLLAACCVVPAVGQDWKEALKSAASNVVDKATGGKATVSFSRRGVFKAVLDTYKVEGVYRYDEDTGELTVECLFAGNPVSFTGRAKHADGVLTLLFEANAALGSLRASSQQYAQNPKLQQIAAILERYPGVMLGAELKRR